MACSALVSLLRFGVVLGVLAFLTAGHHYATAAESLSQEPAPGQAAVQPEPGVQADLRLANVKQLIQQGKLTEAETELRAYIADTTTPPRRTCFWDS